MARTRFNGFTQGFMSQRDIPWDTGMGYHSMCWDMAVSLASRHFDWDVLGYPLSQASGRGGMAARLVLWKNQDGPVPWGLKPWLYLWFYYYWHEGSDTTRHMLMIWPLHGLGWALPKGQHYLPGLAWLLGKPSRIKLGLYTGLGI